VLVACSGGADSLAQLAATVIEARGRPWRVVGVTVDHGLQPGSAARSARVVQQMASLGVDETVGVRVHVEASGQGPEAAAREARYGVLEEVAQRLGSRVVLLGHTLDDQAETVLLGLTRGSGGRSIAGMRPAYDVFVRPLLDVTRAETEAACRAEDIAWWDDPHNEDPRFTRSRVRHTVLPLLERELGPGVVETLARTAGQLRPDMEALDRIAAAAHQALDGADGLDGLPLARLHELDEAVVSRVLRLAALTAGARDAELFHVHVRALVDLASGEISGQVQLPGHVTAVREDRRLRFRPTSVES
jgi:tRNA(Ile)-lysidine synthase